MRKWHTGPCVCLRVPRPDSGYVDLSLITLPPSWVEPGLWQDAGRCLPTPGDTEACGGLAPLFKKQAHARTHAEPKFMPQIKSAAADAIIKV